MALIATSAFPCRGPRSRQKENTILAVFCLKSPAARGICSESSWPDCLFYCLCLCYLVLSEGHLVAPEENPVVVAPLGKRLRRQPKAGSNSSNGRRLDLPGAD